MSDYCVGKIVDFCFNASFISFNSFAFYNYCSVKKRRAGIRQTDALVHKEWYSFAGY